MRRVFLIISFLCLLPFTMMAQSKISSYDEKLEQLYGKSPLAQGTLRDAFNEGDDVTLASNMGYGLLNGSFVTFDPTSSTPNPSPVMSFDGYEFVSAEIVAFNSTTDHIYAYASDNRFCRIDPQTNEITVLGTGVTPMTELAYDVTTKTMYGLHYGVLYTVNMEDGTSAPVDEMFTGSNNWVALAIDKEGKMYGITNKYSLDNADFYYINTSSWNSTKVGTLPYMTQYAQSMAFDRDNGKLYWWNASSAGFNFLQVNPTNAACTAIWVNNDYQVCGMFFKYSPFTYPITYETVENGSFSGPAYAAENDVVEVTVTPDYGYRLGTLTWNGNEINIEEGAPYTFTMIDGEVVVSGSFLLSLHNIIVVDPLDGTLATDPANEGFYESTIVVLPTPDPGFGNPTITYTANGVSNTITAEPWEFIMPDYDVTVSAVYEQTGVNTVSIGTDYYGYFDDIVTVAVELENDNYVAGTQMDIALGDNLTFVPGSLALSERAEGDSWVIGGNVIAGNILRVNTFNNNLEHYAGNSGTIFTFQVQCARVVSNNTLAINGFIAGTPDGTNLECATVNGALEIKDVVMNQPENVVVCNNAEVAEIEFSTTIEETEGEITYAWTNDNVTIGMEEAGEGNIAAFTAINEGDAAVVANVTVTPTLIHNGNPCVGSTLEFTITVNPTPVVETVENIVVCNDNEVAEIVFANNTTDGEVTYAWTNDNAEIGLEAEGTGNIAAFTAVNAGTAAVVANIAVTPTYSNNGIECVGEAMNFTITVNPTPVMEAVENIVVCNGDEVAEIVFANNTTDGEVTYAWTNDNTEIGLEAEGTGNIAAFTAINEGDAAVVANISVVPTYSNLDVECVGEAITFTITVNPTPVMVQVDPIVACNGAEIEEIVFANNTTDGEVTYAWTNDNTEIGLEAEGTGNIAAFDAVNTTTAAIVANIAVVPTYSNNGIECVGEAMNFTITVNPTPVMEAVENIVVCNGDEVAEIVFANNTTDGEVTYAWTNDNAEIGLEAEGTGNIAAFAAINEGNAAVVANISVVPTYSNNGVECVGDAITFTITVNPTPVVEAVDPIVACNGAEIEEIVFANNTTDGEVTYAWTNDNAEIGLEAEGTGNIAAFTAINEGNAAVVANIAVVPTYSNNGIECVGEAMNFTITVNPTPVVEAVDPIVVCNGTEIEEIVFANNTTDGEVTYAWTNDNAEIGLEAEGTGNIAAFTAINEGTAAVVANIAVVPTYSNNGVECVGEAMNFTITVNPTPVVEAVENIVVCNADETPEVIFASNITDGEVTFAWTNDNAEIGLEAEGTGNIAAFAAVNTGTAAAVANITVTPTYSNNGIECVGAPITFTITVNPQVVMDAVANAIFCDNTESSINFTTTITDGEMSYAWTNDNPAIGLAEAGEGDITFLAANTNGEPIVANITVTPTYSNNGIECVGEAISFTITIYPTPVVDEVANQTIYSRESTEEVVFSSNITDSKVIFNWVNDNPAIGLAAAGTGNIPSFIGAAPITETQVGHITVTPVYNDETACTGNSFTFTITVEPTYLVVIADGIENGTLTDNARVAANGEHYAPAGEAITLTATPAEGYLLENVTAYMLTNNLVNVPVAEDQFFTMPEFDVECNATFIDDDNLLIKPGIIDLGFRPINAWMYSKFFDVTNISAEDFDITQMDLTDYTFFNLDEVELPFTVEAGETVQFGINTNYKNVAPGLKNATLALIASHNRKPYLREVVGTAYTPVEPDVWELATNVTSYPYVTTQATKGVIYDNYQLPGETPDGYDGVYKLVFDHDVIINAEVTSGNDPKVVLYDNGFRQVGGPHLDNYHNAPMHMDNMAIIGDGTTTTAYAPYYTYYNYSLSQVIYRADELAAAGLQPGKINSIEYMISSNANYTRDNISIWMANVPTAAVTSTSIKTDGMPLVYTGSHVQALGWNKFEFNGDSFVWDGTSNILITFVMNHGSYNSPYTYWYCTNPGFAATSYYYRDSAPFYPSTDTYNMSTSSTYRPNTKFNGLPINSEGESCDGSPIADYGLFAGTYYLVASSTSEDAYTLEINVDDIPAPLAPTAIYPAHESQGIETPVTFQFELGEYTHEYQLLLGTQYNSQEVVVDWTSSLTNTFAAGELLHNTTYFWRINERNSTGVTEGPLWVFTTELNVPENLTVEDDQIYEDESAILHWDIVADRTLVGYNIYQDGVKINEAPVTENTYSVAGLTRNLDGYDFNVTAAYTEGESDFSNTVNVAVSGYGVLGGHVFEQDGTTGIAGATVMIIGMNEFNEVLDFTFTTDENGVYTGTIPAGWYIGGAEKEGYQLAYDLVGVDLDYNGTITDYDFILFENYNAVSRVVAEEIDANNVHVFWGWDMIEDFESGDFSAYEWVNSTSYPWVITSNNPYEGNYCMKSSNEGIASSTSAIEITMSNEKDGLMSFFARISSESSYDKGILYVDGVAKTTLSGAGSWTEKQVPIAAGTHTFKWSYEKDSSVNSNEDCFYVDYINFFFEPEPLPEGTTYFDFESGMQGWTAIDADGDGHNWGLISELYSSTAGNNDSQDGVASQSYASGALYPDNYLVSPQMELGGTITFWAAPYSASFADEHFGVYVSTTGMNPSDFVSVQEWTSLASKGVEQGGDRERAEKVGTWSMYTADLSAYEGQTGYVAIRHHDCSDEWAILVDDITIQPRYRAFSNFNVYRMNETTGSTATQIASGVTEYEYTDGTWGAAAPGVYRWGVSAVYEGNRGESEITWSNPLDKDMTTNVTVNVTTNSNDVVTGAVVTLTNTNQPELNLVYNTTLDETGSYTWNDFRKGEYNVTVALEGFEAVEATASIWGNTTLNYVLTEIIANIEDLYVSTTGWAMFGEVPSIEPPVGMATITMQIGDVWGDGSGYQMLIDADANAYGTTIPETGALSTLCSGNDAIYAEFEYKIPENADGNCSTQNIVLNNTISIQIPAGTYDWCITNPTPGDRIWIASAQGNVGGRQNDYVFEAGKVYTFSVYMMGSNDATDVTITDAKGVVANTYMPLPNNDAKNINDVVAVNNGFVVLPANTRSVEYYNVKLNGVMDGTSTLPFFQHNVEGLVEGETYTTSVQKIYTTGESEWVDFSWIYTPCDNFEGLQSDPTAEWQGTDVVLNWVLPGGTTPVDPIDPPAGETITEGFENGIPSTWTTIDADGDGNDWYELVGYAEMPGHNGSSGFMTSASYLSVALNPDNYLVTPQVALGGTVTFWACAQDASWPSEHFGIAVSTTNNSSASAFTTIQEWTMTAKSTGAYTSDTRSGNRAQGNWYQYTIDLSAYAGQTGYIAIRHFNCSDWFRLNIDDFEYTAPAKGNRDVTEDFESGTLGSWTEIDADGDSYTWIAWSSTESVAGHNGSTYTATSASYQGVALNPDNYLVSPQVNLGGTLHFWACAQDASWAAEHFGVAVSTSGNTSSSDFTTIQEWNMTSKGQGQPTNDTRSGNRAQGTWYEYTVDLSAYAGQTGYVAIRHFNCTDMFRLNVDDITLTTSGTPVDPIDPPTPADNIIGVEIFRNGEWIAEVQAPAQTYTDEAVDGAAEYEIRVVYDGLTEDYTYYAMSCPMAVAVEDNPCAVTPDNLTGVYEWVNGTEFGALIGWTYGEGSAWLYYDDGTPVTSVGEGESHLPFYWGIMIPAADLAIYNGFALTQVAFYEYNLAGTYTVNIYVGGNNAPGTLVHSQDVPVTGTIDWNYVTLTSALAIDPSQNLWITLYEPGNVTYPAVCGANTGDANGRWLSEDGTNWLDLASAGLEYTWMVRGFVTNAVEPEGLVALEPFNGGGNSTNNFSAVEFTANASDFNFNKGTREPVSFNIYRNGNVIGNVPYTGEWAYTYFDNVAAGNYEYQVTAVYEGCESDFALTPDLSQNYVEVSVTSVAETIDSRIYPNPTTGNVTIEANSMKHITVISALGQVLYDANISGDTYTMNLGQYQAGLYMVRIFTENGVSVKRVTVVK